MSALVHRSIALTKGPIARGSIQSVAIRVTGLAVSFVQAILAARILGSEGYGVAAVALSTVQIAITLAVFGYGRLAPREVARLRAAGKAETIAHFVRHTTRLVAALAVVAGCALSAAALAGLVPAHFQSAFLFSGLAVLPLALLQLQRGIAQGLGRIAAAQVPGEVLRPVLFTTVLAIAFATGLPLGVPGYVIAFAAAALAALALSRPFVLHGIARHISAPLDPGETRRWRIEATPFFGMALVAILLGEINTLLLGWLAGPREAGLFQPVARLVPLMALPVQAAAMRFAPRITELWELGNAAEVARLSRIFMATTLALTAVTALGLALAGPWIMAAFGPEFAESARLLWIVAAAQIFNAACGPVGMLLTMRGRTHAALAGQLAGLAVNCSLGLWLVPEHGALGAAIAMAAGIVGWNLAMLALLRRDVHGSNAST